MVCQSKLKVHISNKKKGKKEGGVRYNKKFKKSINITIINCYKSQIS